MITHYKFAYCSKRVCVQLHENKIVCKVSCVQSDNNQHTHKLHTEETFILSASTYPVNMCLYILITSRWNNNNKINESQVRFR